MIHILHEGRALCGKPGPPGMWGKGHRWVRVADRSKATCPRCCEVSDQKPGALDAMEKVGRLAIRTEGTEVKAYYAMPGDMTDAIPLFSVVRKAAELPGVNELIQALGRQIVGELIFEKFGLRPSWGGPTPAAEHERSGNA